MSVPSVQSPAKVTVSVTGSEDALSPPAVSPPSEAAGAAGVSVGAGVVDAEASTAESPALGGTGTAGEQEPNSRKFDNNNNNEKDLQRSRTGRFRVHVMPFLEPLEH